jgi:hypothetical protein
LKKSASFVYSMSHGNEPRGQPSQSMLTLLMLEEEVDILATCVGLIMQAIIDQQMGPPAAAAIVHCTIIDEDEEMGDFEERRRRKKMWEVSCQKWKSTILEKWSY